MILFVILTIGILGLATVGLIAWWSLRPERPLTLEEQQHVAAFQAMEVPAEMPTESRPPARVPHARADDEKPVLPALSTGLAVAAIGALTGPMQAIQADRDARDYPHLMPQYPDDTKAFSRFIDETGGA